MGLRKVHREGIYEKKLINFEPILHFEMWGWERDKKNHIWSREIILQSCFMFKIVELFKFTKDKYKVDEEISNIMRTLHNKLREKSRAVYVTKTY